MIERLRALEKKFQDEATVARDTFKYGGGEYYDGRRDAFNLAADELATLIAELGQEVGAVPNGKLVGWWNGITPGFDGMGVPSVRWGADAENSRHDIPLYDGYNPIHYVTPPSSPAHTSEARDAERYRALKTHFQAKFHRATCDYWVIVGELKTDPRFIGEDGEQLTLDNALDAAIAAMRQEAGDAD